MPKPDYYHELNRQLAILDNRVAQVDAVSKDNIEKVETLKERLSDLVKDLAIVEQQIADQTKRLEEWDRRLWGLIIATCLALLSSVVGLIVALAKK